MGQDISLNASDGFKLGGYRAEPAPASKAAIVVIQEIFGVNLHIRAVCDRLAGEGYVETIRAKRPEVEIHVYPGAQHGFHCDERASYDKTSADIAWPRSMAFFAAHLKK